MRAYRHGGTWLRAAFRVVIVHLKASKITSTMDSQEPSWGVDTSLFGLTASNQHPYSLRGSCPVQPAFDEPTLYDGESAEGWICSVPIAPQYTAGNYTLNAQTESSVFSVPVLSLSISVPG